MMQKVWKVRQPNPKLQKELNRALGISAPCAQILINRGIADIEGARRFLACDLDNLHEPLLLKGMKKAARRIKKAIAGREKIMVWGDYDIDGIASVALLTSVLKEMGADVCHYLPNRLEEGYGLNEKGARLAKKKGVGLLISVDCGISAHKEIALLKKLGIDAIVCDHHLPNSRRLPSALAIIDPLQEGCPYPYKYLAGVGVAFKLAAALTGSQSEVLEKHLDIVSLGTVGDIVPLTGENRTLVKHGLESFSRTKKEGLKALIEVSGLARRQIQAMHIGYILGPRINASGRMGSPEDSLRLLLTKKEEVALDLAQRLSRGNRLRQRIENKTLQEAIEQVESRINFKEHKVIVLGAPHWHQGVIGIVASRLVERYFRPAIMISLDKEFGRGSGRSIGSFHLLEALTKCEDLLEEYGGHRRACGIKLRKDKFDQFFEGINRVARDMFIPEEFIPTVEIDLELALSDLSRQMLEEFSALAPFGTENPEPLICSYGLKAKSGVKVFGRHIKFWVSDGRLTCEAIGYNKAEEFPRIKQGQKLSLAYSPSINNWQGNLSIQLRIEDFKI